jgi:hypothetical protein
VWYQGGAPLIAPEVRLWPEPIGREGHPMQETMRDGIRGPMPEAMYEVRSRVERLGHPHEGRAGQERSREGHEERTEARGDWTYFTGPAPGAAHVYNDGDVTRQNEKNGAVKYDGKTEKM